MRLGFDLDGTVADLRSALTREARRLFPDIDPASLPASPDPDGSAGASEPAERPVASLSARQQDQLWKAVCARENFWESLDELEPGALARLFSLTAERRWEVIFLTSRPETAGATAQVQSHRWLAAHGFPTPSVFVVHGSRGRIAAALQLDVVVDDRPGNCLDVSTESAARAVLVSRDDENRNSGSAQELGIGVVPSIEKCLDILERLDRGAATPNRMLDHLKRLLGLTRHRSYGGVREVTPPAR
jgi:hypothetical protein